MKVYALILFSIFSLLLSGCHLLHPVTPEPASKIRQMHRLSGDYPSPKEMRANQKKYKKFKKQQEKLAKQRAADTLSSEEEVNEDIDATELDEAVESGAVENQELVETAPEGESQVDGESKKEKKKKKKKGKIEEGEEGEVAVEAEIDPETGEPIESKKNKKKKKKKKKNKGGQEDELASATAEEEMRDNQQLIQEGEFQGEEEEISEKDIKKEVRNADKAQRKELKATEKEAKKQAKADDRANVYRSRVTPIWRLNQNPKIGQQWRKPRQK